MTIPFDGVSLADQRHWPAELERLGYTDLWSSEAASADAFTPLAVAALETTAARLGTAIVPALTRGPATLALSVASLAELAPGRVTIGVGASSPVIVEQWNAQRYVEPVRRVRDTVRFLRRALTGEKVTEAFETFAIRGFRLERVPAKPVSLMIAALGPTMLRLAASESDGAIAVFHAASDVARIRSVLGDAELVTRILVHPVDDRAEVRQHAKPHLAAYLSVPAYEAYHRWLGRSDLLAPMWAAWKAGDRRAAIELVPDRVVDELVVWGSVSDCRAKIEEYVRAGVSCPLLAVQPWGCDPMAAAAALATGAHESKERAATVESRASNQGATS